MLSTTQETAERFRHKAAEVLQLLIFLIIIKSYVGKKLFSGCTNMKTLFVNLDKELRILIIGITGDLSCRKQE